ncbi:RNA exonuclease 1 homolog isoform X2 [Copidosoma floridanum]|uniref:RNA exonuclease 1 homolog isoform X2 n=1 Tax=Copidosoma floridanum TaxID=29053 RepID=UPI0006C9753A|nr:RNA exonuclease 1 homolog isoform X2 [Copidosoma floridanum]
MLPSTGYFKAINCPFYDTGYCERPYCHFKHSRRDQIVFQKDGASTSALVTAESSQIAEKPQNASIASVTSANSNVIEQLVSEAVKKVLADQNVTDTENIVNKVVEGLKPNLVSSVLSSTAQSMVQNVKSLESVAPSLGASTVSTSKSSHCVYNPTPLTDLRKRHIPIAPYELQRESKAVKRKSPESDKPWMDVIRNIPGMKEHRSHKVRYKPTAISHTHVGKEHSGHGYSSSAYAVEESYIPEKRRKKKDLYLPKPKKRREEYVPRKPKVPLKLDQSFEDDTFDDDILIDGSDSNPSAAVNEESQDLAEVDLKSYDDYDDAAITSETKEDEIEEVVLDVDIQSSHEEKENKELKRQDVDKSIVSHTDKEKSYKNKEISKYKDSKSKSSDKTSQEDSRSSREDSKPRGDVKSIREDSKSMREDAKYSSKHKDKEDSRSSKRKEIDSKYSKSKEESKHNKKEEDSKHSKSKDKERGDDKKDRDKGEEKRDRDRDKEKNRDKDKEREREKDKHKHNSKSNDKERSSSLKDNDKSREKVKEKRDSRDSRDNSCHRSKKDLKSDREKSSSSKDSREGRDSKDRDRSKHRHDEKSSHKGKSSSSNSKSKSSKYSHKSSDSHSSYSSHKSDKSNEKTSVEREFVEKDDSSSDMNYDISDQEEKYNSPEYEEFSPMYDEHLLEDSDSDHDVEAECRKIFQEYEVSDHPKDVTSKAPPKPEVEELEDDVSKKRVAHAGAAASITKPVGPSQPLKKLSNPHQRMYERWRMMREAAAEKAAEKVAASKFSNSDHQVNGRIRIAQVPYAQSLAQEKKKVLELAAKTEQKTAAQTKKGPTRIAHIPQVVPQLIRPEPLQTANTQKFPLNVRQFYVNAMQDICSQIYTNSEDAAQRAVREEFACYERCKALNVYKNSCMLTVHRLRKEVDQKSEDASGANSGSMISHEAVLAGKVRGLYSIIKPKKVASNFEGVALYQMLAKWILSEQEFKDNGYPVPHSDGVKGRAMLYTKNPRGQSTPSKVPNQRYCCRCNKPYMVDKHGFAVRKENCIYHYARKFTFRGESKYMCCKQDGSSDGCCDASCHVWDFVDVDNLRGYVTTFDKDVSAEEQGVYSLDCEMCYTTQGLELTRVTVINEKLEVVYETLVKPSHPIIDHNTRFSGISESDMKDVTTTLLDVQASLLTMFSSKTILIGHSLESDFKALKLLHKTVVDTSVMFPHKNGPPFKRALKNLSSEYLRKIIQNDVGGHDSKEDAITCMELVLWKVKEEAKLQ